MIKVLMPLTARGLCYMTRFHSEKHYFLQWLNEFEFVVNILEVKDFEKVSFLLDMLEIDVFLMISSQIAPFSPFELSYEQITHILELMFSPRLYVNTIHYRFNIRKQLTWESPELFALALKQIISKCNCNICTEVNIVGHFVNGLKSDLAKYHLRQVQKLTLDNAILVAQQIDLYEKGKWI
ncbi:hypothetical protein M0804_013379 [Polistes exclamans]|nr:hypothetical protein M0804_013379 [Polistes exclamans]